MANSTGLKDGLLSAILWNYLCGCFCTIDPHFSIVICLSRGTLGVIALWGSRPVSWIICRELPPDEIPVSFIHHVWTISLWNIPFSQGLYFLLPKGVGHLEGCNLPLNIDIKSVRLGRRKEEAVVSDPILLLFLFAEDSPPTHTHKTPMFSFVREQMRKSHSCVLYSRIFEGLPFLFPVHRIIES